ncbi:MAG TPA: Fur family transcriptional regulator [Gaiellaceae bacterium]|nr:Fur family transcriptional regulator [Gaiellaceae bacterium]
MPTTVQAGGGDFPGLLARSGVRSTRQRLEVLGELARERDDVTAQGLWRRLRDRGSTTGLATVYRTLALLSEKGVIDSLSHHGTELCFRLCTESHHHHLLCTTCHRVVEVEQCGIDGWVEEVASRHGFVATEHRVEIAGVCSACR